jgi:hypothetical protein
MLQIDIKKLLALITVAGFFGIILALFFFAIPQGNTDLLKTFGIALISIVSAVAGYYFGSSEGSARKTELMVPPADTPNTASSDPSLAAVSDQAQAGFIRLPLLFLIAAFAGAIALTGCATTAPPSATTSTVAAASDSPMALAGKSLLAVKTAIVTAATATDAFCKAGKIGPDKCAQAKAAYEMAKPAYDAAVDAYLLMSQGYGDPAAFGTALARIQGIADNLLILTGGAN